MQYALLIYETPADFARREQAGDDATFFGAWRAYYKAAVEAGIYAGVKPLDAPETATTVRRRDGKPLVQDGPYGAVEIRPVASEFQRRFESADPR
jgi:hypothetical protein